MSEGLNILMDWDTADEVLEQQLLYMHNRLAQDIKKYKAKKRLLDWETEDLEQFERVFAAIETLGAYCMFEFDKKVKKYAKQQLR